MTSQSSKPSKPKKEVIGFVCEYKKQSAFFSKYEIRYCVLEGDRLQIYKNEKAYRSYRKRSSKKNTMGSGIKNKKPFEIALRNSQSQLVFEQKHHPFVLRITIQTTTHCLSFQGAQDLHACDQALTAARKRRFVGTSNRAASASESATNGARASYKLDSIDQNDLNQKYSQVLQQLGFPQKKIERMLDSTPLDQKFDAVRAARSASEVYSDDDGSLAGYGYGYAKYGKYANRPKGGGKSGIQRNRDHRYWIKQLRNQKSVTAEILNDVSQLIYETEHTWMLDFIEDQGLTLLVSLIPKIIRDVHMQREILQCFKAVCDKTVDNETVGLQFVVKDTTTIQGITDLFDSDDLPVRLLIIKLLSAICWHSPEGFEKIILSLEKYRVDNDYNSIWYPIIVEFKPMLAILSNATQETLNAKNNRSESVSEVSLNESLASPKSPRRNPKQTTTNMTGISTAFAMEFILYSVGLINAALNSFQVLEERVRFRKELETVYHFDKNLRFLDDLLLTMEEIQFEEEQEQEEVNLMDETWIEKMEEHLELYQAVKIKDLRDATLDGIDVSSPQDLFKFLDEHCVEDGFLNELTHILQCLTTIPRNAPYLWGTLEKTVSYATAGMRKKYMREIIEKNENEDGSDDESKTDANKQRVENEIQELEDAPQDAFPSFEQLKVMIGRYDEEEMKTQAHKQNKEKQEQIEMYLQQISNLKYKLKTQALKYGATVPDMDFQMEDDSQPEKQGFFKKMFGIGLPPPQIENSNTLASSDSGAVSPGSPGSVDSDGNPKKKKKKRKKRKKKKASAALKGLFMKKKPDPEPEEDKEDADPNAIPPKYLAILKRLEKGVPRPAIVYTMKQEGLNPDLLDDYNEMYQNRLKPREPPEHLKRFTKMLKIKVPMASVENKMRQCKIDPQELHDFLAGKDVPEKKVKGEMSLMERIRAKKAGKVTGSPLERRPSVDDLPKGMKAKKVINPKVAMRNLHWSKVRPKEIKGTIWDGLDDTKIKIDNAAFESMFSQKVIVKKKKKASSKSKKPKSPRLEEIHLIDPKRSYNVDIGLNRFKMTHSEIKDAVLTMDETTLTLDKVTKLSKFVPIEEEVDILRNFDGDIMRLAHTERFFFTLSSIPELPDRMQLWQFKMMFPEQLKMQSERVRILRDSHDSVKNSKSFKTILRYILAYGNYMNGGTRKGQAFGFKLASLKQLVSAKSTDNSVTLLEFLVLQIEKESQDDMKFVEEFKVLRKASRLDTGELTKDVNYIRLTISRIKAKLKKIKALGADFRNKRDLFEPVMNKFVKTVEPLYKNLRKGYDKALEDCKSLGNYFNCANDVKFSYFGDLYLFSSNFQATFNTIQERREREAREIKKAEIKALRQQKVRERKLREKSAGNSPTGSGSGSPRKKSPRKQHSRKGSDKMNKKTADTYSKALLKRADLRDAQKEQHKKPNEAELEFRAKLKRMKEKTDDHSLVSPSSTPNRKKSPKAILGSHNTTQTRSYSRNKEVARKETIEFNKNKNQPPELEPPSSGAGGAGGLPKVVLWDDEDDTNTDENADFFNMSRTTSPSIVDNVLADINVVGVQKRQKKGYQRAVYSKGVPGSTVLTKRRSNKWKMSYKK